MKLVSLIATASLVNGSSVGGGSWYPGYYLESLVNGATSFLNDLTPYVVDDLYDDVSEEKTKTGQLEELGDSDSEIDQDIEPQTIGNVDQTRPKWGLSQEILDKIERTELSRQERWVNAERERRELLFRNAVTDYLKLHN